MTLLRTLAILYRGHLRTRPLRELLALLGIAAGVALLFAVQVANRSITGSFEQLTEGIAGRASLEVAARGPQGFDQRLFRKVKRLPEVERAAPIVERRISVVGPDGRIALTLIGIDERLESLGGTLVRGLPPSGDTSGQGGSSDGPGPQDSESAGQATGPGSEAGALGIHLTEPTADAIGREPGQNITVEVGERVEELPLAGLLPTKQMGPLSQSPVAVAPLGIAQDVAGMPGQITRILVEPVPDRTAQAKASLQEILDAKLNVRSSNAEAKLLEGAAAPESQASAFFSVVSLFVGILLVYNVMLLTIMERRRVIAGLNLQGASDSAIVASLIFDALILGLAGSVVGVFLGDQLSRHVLHQTPGFLTTAFAIGDQRIVDTQTIILSIAGGTLAALAAAARPTVELLRIGPTEAFSNAGPGAAEARSSISQRALLLGGVGLITTYLALSLVLPKTTLLAIGLSILGMVMILPPLITYLLKVTRNLAQRTSSAGLRIAVGELTVTPIRATALAAVGALAVFAIICVTGPTNDIQRGIRQNTRDFLGNADLWLGPGRLENAYGTQPFSYREPVSHIRHIPQVESVRIYRGSFLDLDDRRLWVVGMSSKESTPISPTQLIQGDLGQATRRFRRGGWVALTATVAKERNLKIGQRFTIPTPSGKRSLRLAATITNYGWPPGVLVVNSRDYARIWMTRQASVLEVDLVPGVSRAAGRRAVEQALGPRGSLRVQTSRERNAEIAGISRQGTSRLSQMADMVLIAAVLAVVAAMLASVWQRRQRLLSLVSLGMKTGQLYRMIFLETSVILLMGCLIGMPFGFLAQALADRWLEATIAAPVPFSPAIGAALEATVLATLLAVVAVAIPVHMVFSARRTISFSPE